MLYLLLLLIPCAIYLWHTLFRYARIRPFEPSSDLLGWLNAQRTVQDIQHWVMRNVTYVSDWEQYGVLDYWPTPGEVWESRKADCDGFHIFMSWAINKRFGHPAFLIVARKSLTSWPWIWHAFSAYWDNEWVVINYHDTVRVRHLEDSLPYIKDGVDPRPYVAITRVLDIETGQAFPWREVGEDNAP